MRRDGFSLIELLVTIAVIALLVSIVMPSINRARQLTRQRVCCMNLREILNGLGMYAASYKGVFPPFAFSTIQQPDVALSGHWGGSTNPQDPTLFGRQGCNAVNLWALTTDACIDAGVLRCPSAGGQSLFPYTDQFSSYCLRFPYSRDVFRTAPQLADWSGELLGIYRIAAGGSETPLAAPVTGYRSTVPLIRWNSTYDLSTGGTFSPHASIILADAFWYQDDSQPAEADTLAVRRTWQHASRFHVARGDGSVGHVDDDGTIAGYSVAPGQPPPADTEARARAAERIWTFMESLR